MAMVKNKKGEWLNIFIGKGGVLSDWIIEDLKTNGLVEFDRRTNKRVVRDQDYINRCISAIQEKSAEIDPKSKLLINLYPPGIRYGFYGIKRGVLSFFQKVKNQPLLLYRFPSDDVLLIQE
ncbi:MAG: hypothetical protein LBT17_00930 [Mycoplasmataceae bacterium]|jgi:hypothetical protein|nr:hypothetical protein [Mycoplasmataceae bacterium]